MPSRNIYHLTWVSLTLDVGYLVTAAPAKHSHCSLPWTRDISSRPPLLTLNVTPYSQGCILETAPWVENVGISHGQRRGEEHLIGHVQLMGQLSTITSNIRK